MSERFHREHPRSVEGPQHRITVSVDIGQEFLNMTRSEQLEFAFNELVKKLSLESELGMAVLGAIQRQRPNLLSNLGKESLDLLDATTGKYAFRAFRRRADGKPLERGLNQSTANAADAFIFNLGIENDSSDTSHWISPDKFWETFLFPTQEDLQSGRDLSMLLVYRNGTFLAPKTEKKVVNYLFLEDEFDSDPNIRTAVDMNKSMYDKASKVSGEEATKYPELRDLFVGSIEFRWNHNIKESWVKKLRRFVRSHLNPAHS